MDKTSARLFAGGDGFGVGARAAGLRSLWGVEINYMIALYAEANDPDLKMIVSDVAAVDYAALEKPWHLHASPSCKNASVANQDAGEAGEDVTAAEATAKAIVALQPVVFTLENVWAYRNFEAFRVILRALSENGYKADFWHLNAADYGVPQSRKRLILVARRDRWPVKPTPTHTDPDSIPQQASLFDTGLRPWVGWYEAIEDLVPTLPESKFAKWQIERLPELLSGNFMLTGQFDKPAGSDNRAAQRRLRAEPANTVTADNKGDWRAFIVSNAKTEYGDGIRDGVEPAHTITQESNGRTRAWLVDQTNHRGESGNSTIRQDSETIWTIPVYSRKHPTPRAWLSSGRVVSLTPRALARLQTFPDDYALPENNGLACTIIGNAVPCLLAQRICESVLEAGNA